MITTAIKINTTQQKKFKAKFKAYNLADKQEAYLKVMSFGVPSSGKTFAIVGFVKAGLRVFVLSTDLGGNGLATVREKLTPEQQKLVTGIDFNDWADVKEFLRDPACVEVQLDDGSSGTIYDWNPDMLVFEGFSTFQTVHLDSYVLSLDGNKNSSRQRLEGFKAELSDFDSIGRGTMWALDMFLNIHHTNGKKFHKYVTFLEDAPREDKISGEVLRGPLLEGRARSMVAGAFDLVILMRKDGKKLNDDGTPVYIYVCRSSTNVSKVRGLPVEAIEPADMEKLWNKISHVSV